MDIRSLARIARSKSLTLSYVEEEDTYVICQRGNMTLMTYAPITLRLITEAQWREELNKITART